MSVEKKLARIPVDPDRSRGHGEPPPRALLCFEYEHPPRVAVVCDGSAGEARIGPGLASIDAPRVAHDPVAELTAGLCDRRAGFAPADLGLPRAA